MILRKVRSLHGPGNAVVYLVPAHLRKATDVVRYGKRVAAKDAIGWRASIPYGKRSCEDYEVREYESLPFATDTENPTPFGRERAAEIWEGRTSQNSIDRCVTPGENAYIRAIWEQMPDETAYMDAFFYIMQHDENQD